VSARRPAGFTLLEVMIALAILAIALVALGDLNGGAVQMHAYARRATHASFLLRSKMTDVEEKLLKEGLSDFDADDHGDFQDEGAPEYRWQAQVMKPDVNLDATQMLSLMTGGGAGGSGSSSSGKKDGLAGAVQNASSLIGSAPGMTTQGASAAGGPMAGLLQTQATQFIETLKKSVREVRVTVYWKDGGGERSINATQHVVILPEMVGKQGQQPTTAAPGTGASGTNPLIPGVGR
jgi:general secretion pathway protein I